MWKSEFSKRLYSKTQRLKGTFPSIERVSESEVGSREALGALSSSLLSQCGVPSLKHIHFALETFDWWVTNHQLFRLHSSYTIHRFWAVGRWYCTFNFAHDLISSWLSFGLRNATYLQLRKSFAGSAKKIAALWVFSGNLTFDVNPEMVLMLCTLKPFNAVRPLKLT